MRSKSLLLIDILMIQCSVIVAMSIICRWLSNMCMSYFDDIQFISAGEYPRYSCHLVRNSIEYFTLGMTVEKTMYHRVDGTRKRILRDGAMHWNCPGHLFEYGPTDGHWHHIYVTFRGSRGRRFVEKGLMGLSKSFFLEVQNAAECLRIMRTIVSIVNGDMRKHHQAAICLDSILSILLSENRNSSDFSQESGHLERIIEEITSEPCRDYRDTLFASRLHLSVSQFRRVFRRAANMPFHQFVLINRIRYCADRIASTDVQIKQISIEAGYEDYPQFSKLFRRIMGMSPQEYRRTVTA